MFFGKSGEIASNRLDGQEASAPALQLLQNCLVHVNTRMMQPVLNELKWLARQTPEDDRGPTPLNQSHVNSYGRFDLDRRIDLNVKNAAQSRKRQQWSKH